jgi:hypothetical protein
MLKQPHKFFDKILDNDLNDLYLYLENLHNAIVNDNFLKLPDDIFNKYNKMQSGAATQVGDFYNIFQFINPGIVRLYDALSETLNDACSYYQIDRKKHKYMIHGWFNLDHPQEKGEVNVSPLKYPDHFHDHSNGQGIPWFHGYYCVNAEPSTTYYKIGGIDGELFENHNKNNRLVLSETGHPHGRDDWYEDKARITIAYDITPLDLLGGSSYLNHIPWMPIR